jgi:ribA/ribD-fused uncharacterized protein
VTTPAIREFRGEYFFLSNFYPSPLRLRPPDFRGGTTTTEFYPTAEHAFQALKSEDPAVRARIAEAHSPGAAKGMGRRVTLRPDWETIKIVVMKIVVSQKFNDNPYLAEKLLATGTAKLVEGNTWGDKFWGVDLATGEGENWLGELLMEVRTSRQIERVILT